MSGTRLVVVGTISRSRRGVGQAARRAAVADRVTILPRHVEAPTRRRCLPLRAFLPCLALREFRVAAVSDGTRRVLVTPEVGMASIVRECGGGLVVEGNAGAIAGGLNRLVNDRTAARAMGEAGRVHVGLHYGWPSVAERMERLYESVLASGKRPGASA